MAAVPVICYSPNSVNYNAKERDFHKSFDAQDRLLEAAAFSTYY
jgi:transposase